MADTKQKLLKPHEPEVFSVHQGAGSVVLTGPHNGFYVPENLYKNGLPLGLDSFWFDPNDARRRHEACDWGMKELFEAINTLAPDITTVVSNYSRLVVDKNRNIENMITPSSSETCEPLIGNIGITDTEFQQRLAEIYQPFHDAVDHSIQETRARHQEILFLDLHSFSPIWNEIPRAVGVGTLTMNHDDFSAAVERALCDQFGDMFHADEPYDLSIHPFRHTNAGAQISERNNIPYVGIEIRNDLIQTSRQVIDINEKILAVISKILNTDF
jgi:predicted N-formylglutamate amidohydrolase